jgi:hypothetical protein
MYENSIRMLNCKASAAAYATVNDDGDVVGLSYRPNICRVQYCEKCEDERQRKFMETYKPYFDVHNAPHIRHLIATLPVIPRGDLGHELPIMLKNVSRFHEKIRKSLGYPFRSILVIEPHYQSDTDSYNFHVHYGIFSMVDIRTFRKLWCRAHGDDHLIVKWPQRFGRPEYKTHKYAFLEYATRRRVQQARTMPTEDYLRHLVNRQLLKRIGFSKEYLALVTTLRKLEDEESQLPDGYAEHYLGNADVRIDRERLEQHFRERYRVIRAEEADITLVKTMLFKAFRDALRACAPQEKPDPDPQTTLETHNNAGTLISIAAQ